MPEQLNERAVHFASMQLPTGWKYAKNHDAFGRPTFSTKRELREALALGNANGEGIVWDGRKL